VGTSNREAHQAAVLIASNPGKLFNYNPLFIYAQSGLGKTHLLHAIGNYVRENAPSLKVLYITTDDFVDEFIKYVSGEKDSDNMKDFFKAVDVLMVDDIQFLSEKVKTEEMFFHIFNHLVNAGKQIILTSDRHPSEIRGIESRLVTRFNSGLTMSISVPDLTTRVAILKKKIEANGLDITYFDEEVFHFFAERFSNNVRELEGALNRLVFYVINIKQTKHITMAIAIESVQPLIGSGSPISSLTENRIINTVADYYNLTSQQLTGRIRTTQIAMARHIAMYLIRTLLDTPFLKIGVLFGGKDHSTVMNAVKKVEKSLKMDEAIATAVDQLQKRLKKA
jgi:chromosomal replication initiator protein